MNNKHPKEPDSLTGPEMDVVTVVFHQFETGLREGTIYTRVRIVTVDYYKFETGLREGTIYTRVSIVTKDFCDSKVVVEVHY